MPTIKSLNLKHGDIVNCRLHGYEVTDGVILIEEDRYYVAQNAVSGAFPDNFEAFCEELGVNFTRSYCFGRATGNVDAMLTRIEKTGSLSNLDFTIGQKFFDCNGEVFYLRKFLSKQRIFFFDNEDGKVSKMVNFTDLRSKLFDEKSFTPIKPEDLEKKFYSEDIFSKLKPVSKDAYTYTGTFQMPTARPTAIPVSQLTRAQTLDRIAGKERVIADVRMNIQWAENAINRITPNLDRAVGMRTTTSTSTNEIERQFWLDIVFQLDTQARSYTNNLRNYTTSLQVRQTELMELQEHLRILDTQDAFMTVAPVVPSGNHISQISNNAVRSTVESAFSRALARATTIGANNVIPVTDSPSPFEIRELDVFVDAFAHELDEDEDDEL